MWQDDDMAANVASDVSSDMADDMAGDMQMTWLVMCQLTWQDVSDKFNRHK